MIFIFEETATIKIEEKKNMHEINLPILVVLMFPDIDPKSNFKKMNIMQFEMALFPLEYRKSKLDKKVKNDPRIKRKNDFDFVGKNTFFGFDIKLSFIPDTYKNENLFHTGVVT